MLENKYSTVSIVIPVFNEKDTILQILDQVIKIDIYGLTKEVIVVDDFSTDGTRDALDKLNKDNVKVLYHQKNQGKGAALRTGFAEVTGQIIIIQDADLEYSPHDYQELIRPILDSRADIVYGSRFIGDKPHRVLYFWHYAGNKILTLFSNMFSNLNLTDMETCYKAFRTEVIKSINLKENRFGFEPEITIKAARHKFIFYEIGISYFGRTYEQGKKINIKDGLRALWCIFKYRFFD